MKFSIILLFGWLVSSVSAERRGCPIGYTDVIHSSEFCYKLEIEKTDEPKRIIKHCGNEEAYMLEIKNEAENQRIAKFFEETIVKTKSTRFHYGLVLGLHYKYGKWKSVRTNVTADYAPWAKGFPQTWLGCTMMIPSSDRYYLCDKSGSSRRHSHWTFTVPGTWNSTGCSSLGAYGCMKRRTDCPADYFEVVDGSNKCYKFVQEPDTFEGAEEACKADGGQLMEVNNKIENDAISKYYKDQLEASEISSSGLYLGLKKKNGDWRNLVESTAKPSYLPWAPIKDTDDTNCAMMLAFSSLTTTKNSGGLDFKQMGGKWAPVSCKEKQPYGCMRDKLKPKNKRCFDLDPSLCSYVVKTNQLTEELCRTGYCKKTCKRCYEKETFTCVDTNQYYCQRAIREGKLDSACETKECIKTCNKCPGSCKDANPGLCQHALKNNQLDVLCGTDECDKTCNKC